MKYKELRNFLANQEKYPNCKNYKRAPLITPGFPGTFNLSFTEHDMFNEFKGYSKFSHNLIFSTIQSCIRPQDILENINKGKELWKYLGVFEMSDVGGQIILAKKENIHKIHAWHLNNLIETLIRLGLKKEKIYPSYQIGGKVSEITENKYNFDFYIPEDSLTKKAFIEAGIPEKNLIPNKTRETLLSLHINMPTPWGYRNEINYNIGTEKNPKLLDIATLEYFVWLPTYASKEEKSKNIKGLKEFEHTVSIAAVGVERLWIAVNNHKTVQEVDYIKEFYNLFKELYPGLNKKEQIKTGEVIRALHRIFSDIKSYKIESIGKQNRNKKIKWFLQILYKNLKDFDEIKIKRLLELNAKVQPWHDNLVEGIGPTIHRIKLYYQSK